MSKSVNKVILLGNLGKDPEVKYTPTQVAVLKMSIATNESYKDKDEKWVERTEWHNVVLWRRQAEVAGQYLKKGSKVYLEGKLQTHSWDDKQTGQKKYMTEVVVDTMVLLGGRGAGEGGSGHAAEGAEGGSRAGSNNYDQQVPDSEQAPSSPIADEDIPF